MKTKTLEITKKRKILHGIVVLLSGVLLFLISLYNYIKLPFWGCSIQTENYAYGGAMLSLFVSIALVWASINLFKRKKTLHNVIEYKEKRRGWEN